jgi:hypothetical protein
MSVLMIVGVAGGPASSTILLCPQIQCFLALSMLGLGPFAFVQCAPFVLCRLCPAHGSCTHSNTQCTQIVRAGDGSEERWINVHAAWIQPTLPLALHHHMLENCALRG